MTQLAALPTARLAFTTPPPGLDPFTEFDLAEVGGAPGLYTMRDTAGAGLRLFLVDPTHYVPEYAPTVGSEQLSALGAEGAEDLDVYVVATILDGAPVVNLLAPVLINPATNAATQVILEDDWPLQAELIAPAA